MPDLLLKKMQLPNSGYPKKASLHFNMDIVEQEYPQNYNSVQIFAITKINLLK
jgi:hypothetical protein